MTMIKKLAVLATATAAFAATPAMAQDTNSDGEASVNILAPLALVNTSSLDFGTIILPTTAGTTGTVVIESDGTLTCPAGGFVCASTTGTLAGYTLTATENVGVTITVPDTVAITNADGDTLTVDLLPEDATLGGAGVTRAIDDYSLTMPDNATGTSSTYAFEFGGQIDLDDTTPSGAYSGPITIDADYQ